MATARKPRNTEGLPAARAEADGRAQPEPVGAAPVAGAEGAVAAPTSNPPAADTGQASAGDPGKPADTVLAIEGEQLAAFEVRSNVLGSHGFVAAGGTVIVNRTDFEALKAAGVIAGEWPEQEVPAG